jgi:hypothetical protein
LADQITIARAETRHTNKTGETGAGFCKPGQDAKAYPMTPKNAPAKLDPFVHEKARLGLKADF